MKTRLLPFALVALAQTSLSQLSPSVKLGVEPSEDAFLFPLAGEVSAQEGERRRPPFYVPIYGANLGIQRFASGRTRDVFGDRAFSIAPGFGPVFARDGLSVRPRIAVINASHDVDGRTNKALFVSVGPLVRYSFVSPVLVRGEGEERRPEIRPFQPYVELGLGLVYADVSARNVGISEKRLTYGASFAIGTTVTKNAFVQLRYQAVPDIEGYEFGSAGLNVGFRF